MNDKDRKIFEKATALINTKPTPPDSMEQLDKLRKGVSKDAKQYFDYFYEGVLANADPGVLL